MAIGIAFKLFFKALFNGEFARRARTLLEGASPAAPTPMKAPPTPATPPKPLRSEALTLLAALQRDARLVDFLKEPIAAYSDAQIGAAVRDVHRDAAAVIERIFVIRPLREESEGTDIRVAQGFDAARIRLTGNVAGQPPYTGKLCHHGWQATQTQLPQWTGAEESMMVIAPAEVEVG